MSVEKIVPIVSLISAMIFYIFTIIVFLIAGKNRLNLSLAVQKISWLALILAIAIPAYTDYYPMAPLKVRIILWALLAPSSWWVMYEVYQANWHGSMKRFLHVLWCKVSRFCRVDDRPQGPTV